MVNYSAQQNRRQAQFVDDAMRQARVQARKAQQTGAEMPSVKGIRESVVQPVQPAAPSAPAQPAAPVTASTPSVPHAPSTPSVPTASKVTSTPRAASVPRVTPTAPAVSSSASGLSGLTGLTGNAGASGFWGSAGTRPQAGSHAQNANTDPLYTGRPQITNDIWGTNAPAAYSPLQQPAPAKASAPKIAQPSFTTSAANAILKVPEAQTSAGFSPAAKPPHSVTVNTAPVGNRSRAAAEETTPDLALDARKLADMRSLYREFSPALKTALEDEYKNDPTGLRVIRGELSADDWLKEKQDALAALQQKSSVDFVSSFNQSIPKPILSAKRYNPHVYSLDQNGQLIQTERLNPSSFDKEYAFNLAAIEHIYEMEKWRKSNTGYRAPNQWTEVPSFSSAVPIFAKILFPQNNASGERTYSSQWLDLSPTLQRHIYEMCKISGVDYYLILATVAHESSSTMKEPNRLTASGYMQQLENLWWAYNRASADDRENAIEYPTDPRYEDTINRIYDYAQNADDGVDFTTSDASILHKNTLANLATGIAHYYVDFRLKEHKNNKYAIAHAVGSYGEGIGSAASYEVLYYRDLLALANGDAPWYMGDLYDIDGKNLNRIPESLESKDR